MSIGMEGCGPNPRTYSKSEYAALEAECERLRGVERQLRQHKSDYMEAAEGTRQALSAELAALKAASGEEVPARPSHDPDVLESLKRENGYWLGEFAGACDMWDEFNAAHQRITAALRGEVENYKSQFGELHIARNMLSRLSAAGFVIDEDLTGSIIAMREDLDAARKQEPTMAMVQAACAAFRMDISPMQAMHDAIRTALIAQGAKRHD